MDRNLYICKKVRMRKFFQLILFLCIYPLYAQKTDVLPWMLKQAELTQQLTKTKDDSRIEDICQQRLHLLDSVYTHYNKRDYNDEWYPVICLSLIRDYIFFEDGQSANKILTNALRQIKDKKYTLAFKVEQIRILILNGDIGGGETLYQEIGSQIENILQLYYKEPDALQFCNIILNYYNAQQMLLVHYIHAINRFQETQQYERGQTFLKSKEKLFTQSFFNFDVLKKIRHTAQTYGLSITDLSLSGITDAKVFYYNQLGTFCAKMGLYVNASNFYYAAESYCDVEDLNSRFIIAHTYLMTARQLVQLGNYMRADEYYAKCISITANSDDKDLFNTMCYAAMELATVKARCGQFNESRDYITMLINYYGSKHLIETVDFINLLWHTVSIVQLEEDYDECFNICQRALKILPFVENIDQNKYRAYFYNQLAYALSRLHKYEEALNCIGNIPQEYYTSNTYYTKASIQCEMGAYKDAILSLNECLCCQEKNEPHDNRLQVYSALLVTAIMADEQINVHELADPFMVLFKEISGISTYSDRAYMLPIYQIYNEIFLSYCRHFNVDIDVAYNLALCFKGAILQTAVDMRNRILSSNDKDLIDKYNQIEQIEWQIAHTKGSDEIEQMESQIYDIEQEIIYKLDKKVDNTSNSYWKSVKDALDENDVSIEFVDYIYPTTSFEYAALILRKDWDNPKMMPLCKKSDLDPLITRLQEIYNSRTHRDSAESYIYKRLYTLIWSKLEPYIHEGDNVYFSPSGLLHQLNIEVLQDKIGRLANEKWNLHRVLSTRELCLDRPAVKWESAALYGGLVYDMDSTAMLALSRAYRIAPNYEAFRGFVADSTARGS